MFEVGHLRCFSHIDFPYEGTLRKYNMIDYIYLWLTYKLSLIKMARVQAAKFWPKLGTYNVSANKICNPVLLS